MIHIMHKRLLTDNPIGHLGFRKIEMVHCPPSGWQTIGASLTQNLNYIYSTWLESTILVSKLVHFHGTVWHLFGNKC